MNYPNRIECCDNPTELPMFKGVFAIMRNNWALEKASVKTKSINPQLRMAVHRFGTANNLRPEEVAAFFIEEHPGLVTDMTESSAVLQAWLASGKVRMDVMRKAQMSFALQGRKF